MALSSVSLSAIFCILLSFTSVISTYFEPKVGDFLPLKRNVMTWLHDNQNKNKHFRPKLEDTYDFDPRSNCREISIDLNLENNFIPSVIKHVYCHNVNDPHSKYCLHKDLICHQKTEAMFITDKTGSCMRIPEEHRRPVGCECKENLQRKK